MTSTPLDGLLARSGGVRGMVVTAVPVTAFAATSSVLGLVPAIAAALVVATIILGWQLLRRESTRPALFGFGGVVVCALFALVTGKAKDFYLPGWPVFVVTSTLILLTIRYAIRALPRPALP